MSETIRIDTPESVDLLMEPAGLGSRFLAALLDALIQWGAALLLFLIASAIGALNAFDGVNSVDGFFGAARLFGIVLAILLLVNGILFFAYKLVLETAWNGQTVGKRAVGIRVVQQNGMPAMFFQVLVRNLMRVVDFLPANYLIGTVSIFATRRAQRLGDIVAGTVVVRERKATQPLAMTTLYHQPVTNHEQLREYARRLSEEDFNPARGFIARQHEFGEEMRARLAHTIAQALAFRMGWPEPLPPAPEYFILDVLYVRAQG